MRQVPNKLRADSTSSLSSVEDYRDALNNLQRAQEAEDILESLDVDQRIRAMVPHGLYRGYLDDIGLRVSTCSVQTVQRKKDSSDLHAFYIELQEEVDGRPVGELRRMEMVDFLNEVRRQGSGERQHVGRRFWSSDDT